MGFQVRGQKGSAWKNVQTEIPRGVIAMVNAQSSAYEKRKTADFVEHSVGSGIPHFEKPSKCHVFVAIIGGRVVGYATCNWWRDIYDAAGNLLGRDGTPLSLNELKVKLWEANELLRAKPEDLGDPKAAAWCLEFVYVDERHRRKGLGKELLGAVAKGLHTPLDKIAYREPISFLGEQLLKRLGLSLVKLWRVRA